MKIEHKVIALSIIIGLFVWVIDAVLDYLYFYKEPFQNVLIPDVPSFEIYIRFTWMVFLLIFGIIASRIIAKRKQVEEELLKFKIGIERSNEAIFITDINGTIVYVNPAFEKIYGYSKEEALGKTPRILKSGVLPQEVYKQFWDTLLAKKVVTGELINKTKDERLLNIEGSSNPILDKDGNITGFLAIQRDITERKLSEAALRESEERYRKLVEYSPDAIAIHSEGKIVFINASGAKLLGALNPEQLIGKTVLDFVHPDYQDIARERIRQMREERTNVSPAEEKFIKLDGSVIDVEVIAMPFTYQGKPGIQVIIRDITDRKSAAEALKQSEEKYRILIDNIQDGVFIIQDDKVQFANEAFARLGGFTVEEIIEKDFRELVAPQDLDIVADRYRRRQAGEEVPREYEFRLMHRDGRTRILVNMNVGLITYRGRVASMGTVKDITEKKRLESQLLQAQRMESVGTLAGGIAHDINNVLTPIMLSLELLREKLKDEESQRLLDTIERSTQRGANLMKQVMSFAKGGGETRCSSGSSSYIGNKSDSKRDIFQVYRYQDRYTQRPVDYLRGFNSIIPGPDESLRECT